MIEPRRVNGSPPGEPTPAMLARLISHGGTVLVVGGGMAKLPQPFLAHPQIIVWDDQDQGISQKEIPVNTKAILWCRWISHADAARLNDAARRMHILKFPLLKTHEVKTLLSVIVKKPEMQAPVKPVEKPMAESQLAIVPPSGAKKFERGAQVAFVNKHVNPSLEYRARGAISKEGERLFKLSKEQGFDTTLDSMKQAVRVYALRNGRREKNVWKPEGVLLASDVQVIPPKPVAKTVQSQENDDFAILSKLIGDAITAMQLVQEHMPKVQQENDRLRQMREKMQSILHGS